MTTLYRGPNGPLTLTDIAWVYILTNETGTVLYTGFTTNLSARIFEHIKNQNPQSFTARYKVYRLVYYQGFLSVSEAQSAEAYIKRKKREWKRILVTKHNPFWKDLSKNVKAEPTG